MKIHQEDLLQRIRTASALELPQLLQEVELYDEESTRAIIDEIYLEFQSSDSLQEQVIIPVFTSIIDGLLEFSSATRKLRRMGLTATRIVADCRTFSYDNPGVALTIPDAYTEWKNSRDMTNDAFQEYQENQRIPYTGNRDIYEDKAKLNGYKEEAFSGVSINAMDEYTGKKNIYQTKAHPDARRNIQEYKHKHLAEVDHIVPLEKIHERFAGNYALSDADIKSIANDESNFALTAAYINRGEGAKGQGGKFDKTISEVVRDQKEREQRGESNLGLSAETKERMLRLEKEAEQALEKNANEKIIQNLGGIGTITDNSLYKKLGGNAAKQAGLYVIGNAIMYLIKPLYYELADICKHGLLEGVGANDAFDAFYLRFFRIQEYIKSTFLREFKDNVWEFVKAFVSSLIEGIIHLFVGMFRRVLKVIKEGVKILYHSGTVLFGSYSKVMSPAEKGDAILKIVGGGVIAISGVGVETLLNEIGVPDPLSIPLSTMLSGIATVLFMYLLDQADLFSVKAEKRYARIREVFEERIRDIKELRDSFNTAAIEILRQQRLQFEKIESNLKLAIDNSNTQALNDGIYQLASCLGVDLRYRNLSEFEKYMASDEIIEL